MAIRNRRGNSQQFDKSRLLSGEFAYVLDTGELFYCYGANNVKKLATEEDLQNILNSSEDAYTALLQLIQDLESNPSEITSILNNITDLQINKLDKNLAGGWRTYSNIAEINSSLTNINTLKEIIPLMDNNSIIRLIENQINLSDMVNGSEITFIEIIKYSNTITVVNGFKADSSVTDSTASKYFAIWDSDSVIVRGFYKLLDNKDVINSLNSVISTTLDEVPCGTKPVNELNTYLKNRYTESLSELQIAENTFQVTINYNSGLPLGVWTTIATFNPTTYKNTRIDFGNSYMFTSEGFMMAIDSSIGTGGIVRLNYITGEVQGYSATVVGLRPLVRVIYNK